MTNQYNLETDQIQRFINEQRRAAEPEVAQFFATKISEKRAAHLLGLAISTFRAQRARGTLKVGTVRRGYGVLVELEDVMAILRSRSVKAA